ncbi:hypothetical protein PPSIR1_32984, partial [Plesiocystis pacifica SIR-1]
MLRPTDKAKGPRRVPEGAWLGAALVGAALALAFGGQLGRWIAMALVLAAWPNLAQLFAARAAAFASAEEGGAGTGAEGARTPRERAFAWARAGLDGLRRAAPLLVVLAVAWPLLGELALGHAPASRDHGIHYFQMRILVDELIPQGRLAGFSDRLNTGYPFGDSYPVLGYLLTGAAYLLSGGLVDPRTSYAWGLLAIWALGLGGVWWLASTIAEELSELGWTQSERDEGEEGDAPQAPSWQGVLLDPRWAGALAALCWLIDPGASREGGWNYTMFHGVWPQLLSSALWVTSLPATWAALRRPTPRRLALAALLLGLSVLAHPFGMLTAAASGVAWPVVVWATGAMRGRLPDGAIRWWALIHFVAVCVCVGGVYLFLTSAGSMARSPVPWKPLGDLATELVTGELFADHRAWVGPMAVVGLILAVRRGRAMAWLGLVLLAGLLVLASEEAITVLRLDLMVSGFKNLQFPRYSMAIKPVFFAFAGVGAAALLARLRAVPDRDRALEGANPSTPVEPRPWAARVLACLCLAPLIVGVLDDSSRLLPRPAGALETLEGTDHARTERALLAALEAEAQARAAELEAAGSDEDPRLAVAFLRRGMGGGTYPLFAITDAEARLVLDGHIPAVNYRYQVRRRSPDALRLMGVTHVLYDHPLTRRGDDTHLEEALETVGSFGVWTLGRLAPAEDRVTNETVEGTRPFETAGAIADADVRVERLSAEHVRVHVAEGIGRVDLALGPYRKWVATRRGGDLDGTQLALDHEALSRGIPGVQLPFPEASGAGERAVELVYERPARERQLGWVSLVSAALCLLALGSGRELELAGRLESERSLQISWALGLLTLGVILAGVVRHQQRQLVETWDKVLSEHV